jgi:hypothetical protein
VSERSLLTTVLVAAQLPEDVPEARMLRGWLDSWSGVGHVVEGMHDLGYDVRLTQSPFVWWAEFCREAVTPLPRWLGQGHDATTSDLAHTWSGSPGWETPPGRHTHPIRAERRP